VVQKGGAKRWCKKVVQKGGAKRWCKKVVQKGGAKRLQQLLFFVYIVYKNVIYFITISLYYY
jgi:hypothetical protein